ncbi:hypothetical protein Tco_0477049, partial [Tanacetum coccineum]
MEGVNQGVKDLVTTARHDTDEVYGRLDDAQDDRSLDLWRVRPELLVRLRLRLEICGQQTADDRHSS